MSRNVSSVSLNSYVNLIVWCNWLIVFMYIVNSDADPVQMTKMSSMNLSIALCVVCLIYSNFLLIFP